MNFTTSALFCIGTAALIATATAENTWMTDFSAALKKAEAEKKLVLADFTGSDWCSACILLRRSVLDTAEFRNWAKDKFILLEIDLPKRRNFDATLRAQNEALAARYNIISYPSILALNENGEVMGGFEGNVKSVKEAIVPLEDARRNAENFRKLPTLKDTARARVLNDIYHHFPKSKTFAAIRTDIREQALTADPNKLTNIHLEAAVEEQAEQFRQERSALIINSPEMKQLLKRQLRDAYPANRPAVQQELCQYALATAENTADIAAARKLFEELIPQLAPEQAAETQNFVDTFFTDPEALLRMLKASRPQ